MKLTNYEDFLARVDELGFMSLGCRAFPALFGEVPEGVHTGDPDVDPWCWKDRAAKEKKVAFGCILGGHKGFVSVRMYPLFYAAYHPVEPIEDLWASGELDQTTWRLWRLFEEKNVSQYR
jgi:hypothetical protein